MITRRSFQTRTVKPRHIAASTNQKLSFEAGDSPKTTTFLKKKSLDSQPTDFEYVFLKDDCLEYVDVDAYTYIIYIYIHIYIYIYIYVCMYVCMRK